MWKLHKHTCYYFLFSFYYCGSWSLTLSIYIIFAQSLPFYIGVKFNVFPDVMRSLSCPCDSCQNPVESGGIILAGSPAKIAIPELRPEWSQNGPEQNPAKCN